MDSRQRLSISVSEELSYFYLTSDMPSLKNKNAQSFISRTGIPNAIVEKIFLQKYRIYGKLLYVSIPIVNLSQEMVL